MKRAVVVWTIASLLAGTAICLAAESKEKPRRPDKEFATEEAEVTGSPQAYLGIGIEAVPPALVSHLPGAIPGGQGVLIAQVANKSPAEKAGLKTHDIVLAYGQHKVGSPEELVTLVHKDKPGREVTLHVIRAGKPREIKVVLGEANTVETPRRHRVLRPLFGRQGDRKVTPEQEQAQWSTFDSMALTRLDENRFRAEIKYRDQNGKIDSRTYEGTRAELRKAIESEKNMPDAERGHLLSALDMPGASLEFGPAVFMTPGGEVIWDFGSLTP